MVFSYYISESEFSNEFKYLQKLVQIIDEDYIREWGPTAKEEKIEFFKRCHAKTAFNALPNLAHPAGYTLVQFLILFLLSRYYSC